MHSNLKQVLFVWGIELVTQQTLDCLFKLENENPGTKKYNMCFALQQRK